MRAYFSGKRHELKAENLVGSGGEADVYDLGDGRALKLFKRPEHPDFSFSEEQRQAAAKRLQEHQRKLGEFPRGLPEKVVGPLELGFDRRGGRVAGYVMPLIRDTEPLLRLGEKSYRDQGVGNRQVVQVFASLHATLRALHACGVVVGDFNDLNVLFRGGEAWIIDADSMQFGNYRCAMFTERFVDPLLCDPKAVRPVQVSPHGESSDWYAFNVMLFRSLLLVDPYGGVYRPGRGGTKVAHSARPLHRLAVFHPEVKFPRAARCVETLSEALLEHFRAVFQNDRRGVFPLELLRDAEWQLCGGCGLEFAREACPGCGAARVRTRSAAGMKTGGLAVTEIFRSDGQIVGAASDGAGGLEVLVWKGGGFYREHGRRILDGSPDPRLRMRLSGGRTVFGRGSQLLVLGRGGEIESRRQVDLVGGLPAFDTNRKHLFWVDRGRLFREGDLGDEPVGDVLAGQTRFWAGDTFGYGFYRAGGLARSFVFDATHGGIDDSVPKPPISGQLLGVTCHLSDELAWVGWQCQERGKIIWRLQVLGRRGELVAARQVTDLGEAPWLESLHGAAAGGRRLLIPGDTGLLLLDADSPGLEPVALPGGVERLEGGSYLFRSGGAVCAVGRSRILKFEP